jgi:hypothetical protein
LPGNAAVLDKNCNASASFTIQWGEIIEICCFPGKDDKQPETRFAGAALIPQR